jgi:hypothetical protein
MCYGVSLFKPIVFPTIVMPITKRSQRWHSRGAAGILRKILQLNKLAPDVDRPHQGPWVFTYQGAADA